MPARFPADLDPIGTHVTAGPGPARGALPRRPGRGRRPPEELANPDQTLLHRLRQEAA